MNAGSSYSSVEFGSRAELKRYLHSSLLMQCHNGRTPASLYTLRCGIPLESPSRKWESCTVHCSKPLYLARGQAEKGLRPEQKSASDQVEGQTHEGLLFLPPGFAPNCSQEVQCLSCIGDGSVYLLCPVAITLEGDPEVTLGVGSFTSIWRLSGEVTPLSSTGMKTVFWADKMNPLFLMERTVMLTSSWKIFRADFCRGPFLFGRLNVVVLQMARSSA